MVNATVTTVTSTTVTVSVKCPFCGKAQTLTVPRKGFDLWRQGALVQVAFPDLSPDDREVLVSGVCPKCWEDTFGA